MPARARLAVDPARQHLVIEALGALSAMALAACALWVLFSGMQEARELRAILAAAPL